MFEHMLVADPKANLGGMRYGLLEHHSGDKWRMHSANCETPESVAETLKVLDSVQGLTLAGKTGIAFYTGASLKSLGLVVDPGVGVQKVSKRVRRILGPQFFWEIFSPTAVRINATSDSEKLWDGICLVDKAFAVRELSRHLADNRGEDYYDVPKWRQFYLRMQLKRSKRAQFTYQGPDGQVKGHCLLVKGLNKRTGYHIQCPREAYKTEVKSPGYAYVAMAPVKLGDLYMNIQSVINFSEVFSQDTYIGWLRNTCQSFLDSVRKGKVGDALKAALNKRLRTSSDDDNGNDLLAKAGKYWLLDFVMSGGGLWFKGVIKAMGAGYVKHLEVANERFRLPTPGFTVYLTSWTVWAEAVGPNAPNLPSGKALYDKARCSIVVSVNGHVESADCSCDYCTTCRILGGADQDDAISNFVTLYNGKRTALVYRSPAMLGEYMLFEVFPAPRKLGLKPMPSVKGLNLDGLPPRIDTIPYVVDALPKQEHEEWVNRQISWDFRIKSAAKLILRNTGALGSYSNVLMVLTAVDGNLPHKLPASMEDVIDASVKDGIDLSHVHTWCRTQAAYLLGEAGVPSVLRDRIAGMAPDDIEEKRDFSTIHELDELDQAIADERIAFSKSLNRLAEMIASPPVAILDWFGNLASGHILRKAYSSIIRDAILDKGAPNGEDFEQARIASENVLLHLSKEEITETLMGAMCAVATDSKLSDAVLFQLGEKLCEHKAYECECQRGREAGMAQATIAALRDVGLLSEPQIVDGDIFQYLNDRPRQPEAVDVLCSYGWFLEKRIDIVHFSDVEPSEKQQLKDNWEKVLQRLKNEGSEIWAVPDSKKPLLMAQLSSGESVEIGWQRNDHIDVSGLVVKSYRAVDGSGDCFLLRCIRE
jgi:hypothetical protein